METDEKIVNNLVKEANEEITKEGIADFWTTAYDELFEKYLRKTIQKAKEKRNEELFNFIRPLNMPYKTWVIIRKELKL